MILGLVPDIGIKLENDSRYGNIIKVIRPKCSNKRVMQLRDDTLLVEGALLYNSVPQEIRKYDGSYLGFKNLIDAWLQYVPDKPRVQGVEPEARDAHGEPSNAIRCWAQCETIARMNVWKCDQFLSTD